MGSSLYAQVLPPGTQQLLLGDFSGGLNTTVSPHKVPLDMSPNMRNVYIDEKPGSIVTVLGFTVIGSTRVLQRVTGIFPYFREDGEVDFIVTDSSIALSTKDFQFYTFVSSNLTSSSLLRCKQILNKMWCSNSVESVFTWDGTDKVLLDGTLENPLVPKFKYIEFYQGRVFGLNTDGNGSSLDFSAIASTSGVILDPDAVLAWPTDNRLNVGQGDGTVGTALWIANGQLQVGKETSVYTIFGTDAFSYQDRKTLSDIGVISHDSVVVLDDNSYFLGQDGIYENNRRISDSIIPDVEGISRDTTETVGNVWDTQEEFKRGSFLYGSTATVGGILEPQGAKGGVGLGLNFIKPLAEVQASDEVLNVTSTGGHTSFGEFTTTVTINETFHGHVFRTSLWARPADGGPGCGQGFGNAVMILRNDRTGATAFRAPISPATQGTFKEITYDFTVTTEMAF